MVSIILLSLAQLLVWMHIHHDVHVSHLFAIIFHNEK